MSSLKCSERRPLRRRTKIVVILLIVTLLLAFFFTWFLRFPSSDDGYRYDEPHSGAFNLENTSDYQFVGFGAQIWGYNDMPLVMKRVLKELNIRFARISRETASWDQLNSTWKITNELGIQWVLVPWKAPDIYQDQSYTLKDVQGFADWWVQEVAAFAEKGIPLPYIELVNEPDSGGEWSTVIDPKAYNELVKLVRKRLDAAGFNDTGLIGPGLSHLNWKGQNNRYISALDSEAVNSLSAWSSHAWDDGDLGCCGATFLETELPTYVDAAKSKDPDKLRFISEFATKETTFYGETYPDADHFGEYNKSLVLPYYSVTASIPYAARVFENTLALLNHGIQAAFIWQAKDESAEVHNVGKSWGLVDIRGHPKPVYTALLTLYPTIPIGARVVNPPNQQMEDTYAAVFTKDNDIIVAIANNSNRTNTRTIGLERAGPNLIVESALAFVPDDYGDISTGRPGKGVITDRDVVISPRGSWGSYEMKVELPQDSTLTVVLKKIA